VVAHGLARKHVERRAVLERAIALVGGDVRRVFVLFEQHDHMPLSRLTAADHTTQRMTSGRRGGVERGPKQIYGMGKAYGRWEECCDLVGIRDAQRAEVRPSTWRTRIHGVTKGAQIKRAAIDYVKARTGLELGEDEAEGYCIALFAAFDGIARHDAERLHARAKARAQRAVATQGTLFGSTKP
jgi:hypothetical protein